MNTELQKAGAAAVPSSSSRLVLLSRLFMSTESEAPVPGFVHEEILLRPVAGHFCKAGARIHHQYRTGPGRRAGMIDLFIEYGSHRIAIEAETSPDRVGNDVAKAVAVRATLLLIIAPERRIAKAVRRRLNRPNSPGASDELEVWVLPLGQALQRIRNCFPLMTRPNVRATSSLQERPGTTKGAHHEN